jgi:hypothetical protein
MRDTVNSKTSRNTFTQIRHGTIFAHKWLHRIHLVPGEYGAIVQLAKEVTSSIPTRVLFRPSSGMRFTGMF